MHLESLYVAQIITAFNGLNSFYDSWNEEYENIENLMWGGVAVGCDNRVCGLNRIIDYLFAHNKKLLSFISALLAKFSKESIESYF